MQQLGTRSRPSSVYLVRNTDWILTLWYVFWATKGNPRRHNSRTCNLHKERLSRNLVSSSLLKSWIQSVAMLVSYLRHDPATPGSDCATTDSSALKQLHKELQLQYTFSFLSLLSSPSHLLPQCSTVPQHNNFTLKLCVCSHLWPPRPSLLLTQSAMWNVTLFFSPHARLILLVQQNT